MIQSDNYVGFSEPFAKSSRGAVSRPISYLILFSVYTVTILLGWLFLRLFSHVDSYLLQLFIVNILCTCVVFIFSLIFQNSSLYDPYTSVASLAVSWYWWSLSAYRDDTVKILAIISITLFSIKHLGFYYRAWPGLGWEDNRFVDSRRRFKDNIWAHWLFSFAVYHCLTTAIFFLGLLPLYYIMFSVGHIRLWLVLIGFAMCLAGIVADPVAFWFGLYFMALGVHLSYWWTIIGPLAMFALLLVIKMPYQEVKILRWTGVNY